MAEHMITISNLTKDFGKGRGIFDISLEVKPGEIFGYLGTNGSGKTTTIRSMMGFLKPNRGSVLVNGLDPWSRTPELMQYVSYIPGEIAFPALATGTEFLKVQAQYLGVKDFTRMNYLIDLLGLDPTASLKRMSKGMKQKTAIVAALMGDRRVLILDEPTTGLDPLMRDSFLKLIREEKQKGNTVFMSSHIFEEIEDVCDRMAIIQDGKIKEILNLSEFRSTSPRQIEITFADEESARIFAEKQTKCTSKGNIVRLTVLPSDMKRLFAESDGQPIISLHEEHIGLEEHFMNLYHKEQKL